MALCFDKLNKRNVEVRVGKRNYGSKTDTLSMLTTHIEDYEICVFFIELIAWPKGALKFHSNFALS